MIAIVDYGVGNLFSLQSSLKAVGGEPVVSSDPELLLRADKILLPGVGAFGDAAEKLKNSGLRQVVLEQAKKGTPLLGICLGMQLLFDKSYEYGEHAGLGLIPGTVAPIEGKIPETYKIPHIGWNGLEFSDPRSPLFADLTPGDHVYFVHSFAAVDCDPYVSARTEYGAMLTAAAEKENVFGCQFHPEKSGAVGLKILDAFCRL